MQIVVMQLHSVNSTAVILNICTVGTWLLGFDIEGVTSLNSQSCGSIAVSG
jgi:hypothetical protein